MFKRLIKFIKRNFIPSDILADHPTTIHKPVTVQEDTRAQRAIERVKAVFERQQKQMDMRAMKSHEFGCAIFDCNKPVCFKRSPDKIVSTPIIEPYKRKMSLSMGDFKKKKLKTINRVSPLSNKES